MSPKGCHAQGARWTWERGLLRGALLAAAFLTLGCADGYPTEDVPSVHPAEMNQAQRLALMNELGNRPHLSQRWTYSLADGCQLTIGKGSRTVVAPLKGAAIKSSTSDSGQSFSVLLVLPERPPSEALVALEGARWFDLVQMRSLLDQVQRSC